MKLSFKKVPGLMWGSILMVVFFMIFAPNYMTQRNIVNILQNSAILLIVSMGMGITILSGQIDMSIGGVMTVSAVVAAVYLSQFEDPTTAQLFITLLIGIGTGCVFGFLNGILISKFNFNFWLVTFAMMSISYGFARVFTDGKVFSGFSKSFRNITRMKILGIPNVVIIAIVVSLIMFFLTYKTRFGMHLYAVGDSEKCAKRCGINVALVRFLIYFISGLLAGFGGVLLLSKGNLASANVATGQEFTAMANVIIGGTSFEGGKGGLFGTFAGTIILAAVLNGLQLMGLSNYLQQVFTGAIILGIIIAEVVSASVNKQNNLRRKYKDED